MEAEIIAKAWHIDFEWTENARLQASYDPLIASLKTRFNAAFIASRASLYSFGLVEAFAKAAKDGIVRAIPSLGDEYGYA